MTKTALSKRDIRSLSQIVGDQHVTVGEVDCLHYTHDSMSRTLIQSRRGRPIYWPQAVVWPGSTADVVKLVQWAQQRQVPLIAFGGGSGVAGGTLPVRGGVIVDLKRLDQIESINARKRTAIVQSGINSLRLEKLLNDKGYTLGHFPSSILVATLGGCLAARGAGQLSSKYGNIEDMIDSVEAVLPSGEILPIGSKRIPGLPGVTPVPLFVGSEGVLGIVTRCRVRLHRKAQADRYRGISFVHLSQAIQSLRRIMQAGLRPSVLRLYDRLDSLLLQWGYERNLGGNLGDWLETVKQPLRESILNPLSRLVEPLKSKALNRIISYPRVVDFVVQRMPVSSVLVMGFEGDPDIIKSEEVEALKICREVISRDEGPAIGEHWRKHRYSVSYKMPELFAQGNFVDTIEVAATWDCLEELYKRVRKAIARHCFVMAHFSHAYPEGCSIYFTFVGRQNSVAEELRVYDQVWGDAMDACLQAGGTITHHHGVGLLKAKYMSRELGRLMDVFRNFKNTLDPNNIMNPGKMGLS